MSDLSAAREYLGVLLRAIRADELETCGRVARMTGLDGDAKSVSRREWCLHHARCGAMRRQIIAVADAIATVEASGPQTMIVTRDEASRLMEAK